MNLQHIYRKKLRKPINLYWWQYDPPNKLNFGDEITPYIINKLFGLKTVWSEPSKCDLAGAGSIIEILQEASGGKQINVWGSGFIKQGEPNEAKNLNFLAVRGKHSLSRINQPATLGDPGLLMSVAYPVKLVKKYRLGLIPHYVDVDQPLVESYRLRTDVKVINILDDIETVTNEIVSCELILSSSLHGLIVSDSYAIPNYWLPLSDELTGGAYKFEDYYSVHDLKPNPQQPIKLSDKDIDRLINTYTVRANIELVQKSLIKSFPY